MDPAQIKQLGLAKIMTMTSTYDHRVIQGAESGSFLRLVDQMLQGEAWVLRGGRDQALGLALSLRRRATVASGANGLRRLESDLRRSRTGQGRARSGRRGDGSGQGVPHPRPSGRTPRSARRAARRAIRRSTRRRWD